MELRKVKLFHKNFSLRIQRINLVSSKVRSQRSQNPLADPPLLVLVVKHDWNAFVAKFLRGLQNCLKIRSSSGSETVQRFSELCENLRVSSHQILTSELTVGNRAYVIIAVQRTISVPVQANIRPFMLLVINYLQCGFRPVNFTSQNLMWRDSAIFTKFWKPLYIK